MHDPSATAEQPGEAGRPPDALENRLLAIFDGIADGVTVLDRSWTVRFANDAAAHLMGRASADELIGGSAAALTGEFDLLAADGGPLDRDRMPTRRAMEGEESPEEVIRFRRKGTLEDRWSLVRAKVLRGETSDGDLVVTAFQDITSLKRSEGRLRFLAEASAILSQSVNYQETLARVARIAVPWLTDWCVVDVLGWTGSVERVAVAHSDPAMVALAEELRRRWPPQRDGDGAVARMLESRRPVHLAEVSDEYLTAMARDDEHLSVLRRLRISSALVVPLEARGEVMGALSLVISDSGRIFDPDDIALAEDLGRRAGAAIDAARLVWDSQETSRMRDEFIALASHDMRTPLAAVRGYAQLARRHIQTGDDVDFERLDRWLGDIDHEVSRLNRLVSELMDTTLVQSGQDVPLQAAETDLEALVRSLLDRHASLEGAHTFVLDVQDPAPVGVWDPARLARVIENILSNAVKFSPEGGEVRMGVGVVDGRAFVRVSDRGMGIAPSDMELIFSPMYRGRNARGVLGTGLGLAGSRRLIEQMGGAITVESKLGNGSTFTVWLPLQHPGPGGAQD